MTEQDITWLTRQEAATRAGVALRTIDRWRSEGRLTTSYLRRRYVRINDRELNLLTEPQKEERT